MEIAMLIERTSKYLDKMQRRLSFAQKRNAPAPDIENLKIKVEYYSALLNILEQCTSKREASHEAV